MGVALYALHSTCDAAKAAISKCMEHVYYMHTSSSSGYDSRALNSSLFTATFSPFADFASCGELPCAPWERRPATAESISVLGMPLAPGVIPWNISSATRYTFLSSAVVVSAWTHWRRWRRLGGRAAMAEGGRAALESRKEPIHSIASSQPCTAAWRKRRSPFVRSVVSSNPDFSASVYN